MQDLKFFKDAQKAAGKTALLHVIDNRVMLISPITGTRKLFINSKKEIIVNDRILLDKIKSYAEEVSSSRIIRVKHIES